MSDPDQLTLKDYFFQGWQKAALGSALRALAISLAVIGLSAVVSEHTLSEGAMLVVTIVSTIIWLTVYFLYIRWMTKRIARAEHPLIPGLEALAVGTVIFLAVFAKSYYLISLGNPEAFTEPLDVFSSYYFTVTVLATVGFGDITPVTVAARSFSMVQMLFDIILIAMLVRLITTEVRTVTQRRKAQAAKAAPQESAPQ